MTMNDMLLMSYEYIKEHTIDNAILFSFPEEDLTIIKDDWHKIMQKIKTGTHYKLLPRSRFLHISERQSLFYTRGEAQDVQAIPVLGLPCRRG